MPPPQPHIRGGEHTDFGADPVGVSVGVSVGVGVASHFLAVSTISCEPVFGFLLNFQDTIKNCLDFGELYLIFKVTTVEKLKIHGGGHLFSLKTLLLV